MPRKPHPDRSKALSLLREGKTPKEVLAALPVRRSALYKWMAEEGLSPPGVRAQRPLSERSREILSAILYLEIVARPEGQEDLPTDREIGAIWGPTKQRVGALRTAEIDLSATGTEEK